MFDLNSMPDALVIESVGNWLEERRGGGGVFCTVELGDHGWVWVVMVASAATDWDVLWEGGSVCAEVEGARAAAWVLSAMLAVYASEGSVDVEDLVGGVS